MNIEIFNSQGNMYEQSDKTNRINQIRVDVKPEHF